MRFQTDPGVAPAPSGHIIVVGGGIGGMVASLALSRQGHDVSLFEQDDVPARAGPEQAFTAPRRGVPQARQTHGLLARLTQILRRRFPDVLDQLLARGAREVPMVPPGGATEGTDDDVTLLLVRRTTLEWVLRRAVLAQEGVRWQGASAVVGLLGEPAPGPGVRPRIRGVRLADGTSLPAEAVVVSTGRRGNLPGWFAGLGITLPETVHRADLVYLTRWYRTPPGAEMIHGRDLTGDLGYLKYLAVPCDGDTLSVTLAVPREDRELRHHLVTSGNYERAAARLAGLADVFAELDPVPLGAIEPMGGFINRIRRFLDDDGRPLLPGVHAVGDVHTCTNPYYGRGCSLAAVQAVLLADAFAAHEDPAERSAAYEAASAREVEPWFHHAVATDTLFDPAVHGRERGGMDDDGAATVKLILTAAASDAVIGRGMQRVFNLLTTPDQLLADRAFMQRVSEIVANPSSVVPLPPRGPERAVLLGAGATDEGEGRRGA